MILVAGGAGFIGSVTSAALAASGRGVLIADNFSNSEKDVVERISTAACKRVYCETVELTDRRAVKKLFEEYDIEGAILLAGYKCVPESVEKPLMYFRNNLEIVINVLEEMDRVGAKKAIFSSSATVYDAAGSPSPLREDSALGCSSPYGRTKLMCEQMLSDVAKTGGWSIVSLRYFNPVGAHPTGLLGEEPRGVPNNLMPYISRVATGELPFLNVYGSDYPTPDGTGVRDYIHIYDLARGHVSAYEYAEKHEGMVYVNLGTGRGASVLELVHAYERACGKKIPYKLCPRRPGDVAVCFADNTLAKKLLDWEPEYGIDEMCADDWRFTLNRRSRG